MPTTRPIIVFDLDGTLIDTAPDLLDSLNHVLARQRLASLAPDKLKGAIGHGARVMLKRAHAAQGRTLSEAETDALMEVFIDHYGAGMPGQSRPFGGVRACLDRFETAGYTLAVCTNKPENLSRRLLEALDLAARFAAICGADTFDLRKPDPGHLTGTVVMAGGDPSAAIMIGDSGTDIDTARAAGIPVVAVDFGYSTRPVDELGPDRIISHFDQLTVTMADGLIGTDRAAEA